MPSTTLQAVLDGLAGRPAQVQQPDSRSWPERLAEQVAKDRQIQNDGLMNWWEETKAGMERDNAEMIGGQDHDAAADRALRAGDYPVALVEPARAAVAHERRVYQALLAATAAANAWISEHGEPSAVLKDAHTVARTAHRKAQEAASVARLSLGRDVETIDQARARRSDKQRRKSENDVRWQAEEDQIDADDRADVAVLKSLGIT